MMAITDTTVLSNFAVVGALWLLQDVFDQLVLPTEVFAEIQDGVADGYRELAPLVAAVTPPAVDGWLQLVSVSAPAELDLLTRLPVGLHRGEAACLAIAVQRDWLLLTDDRAARSAARRLGVRVSGSIGCLVVAVERAVITLDVGNTMLAAMIATGYFAPTADLTPLLVASRSARRTP